MVPGPALTVTADTAVVSTEVRPPDLTVHLKNTLPTPTSLVINGLVKAMAPVWTDQVGTGPVVTLASRVFSTTARVRSFDAEASPGGVAVYVWPKVKPGTYLYQSGTQPQVQVQMGLYGALTKNALEAVGGVAPAPAQSYPGAAFAYDNQATLLYSEIDPALHAAVADGSYGTTGPTSTFNYAPKYFLINGQPYPGNAFISPTGSANTGTTLLRLLNAGLTTHVPMIEGTHWQVIAEDGKPYAYRRNQYTALLPAAKTVDVMLTPEVGAQYPILDRRLSFSNGGVSNGGMLAFLNFGAVGSMPVGSSASSENAAPTAMADTYATPVGVTLNVSAPGVLANDTDPTFQTVKAVAARGNTSGGGSFTLQANGSFSYVPPLSGSSDSFTYLATDGVNLSTPATVSINLTTPTAPSLELLDDFNAAGTQLSSAWTQRVVTTANLQLASGAATGVATDAGAMALWDSAEQFGTTQYAGFTLGGASDKSALILKASGGNVHAQPANFVRVRYDAVAGKMVVETAQGGSNAPTYVKHAEIAAPAASGQLSAMVDDKALVTVFLNGAYIGGVQLPDVTAWKGTGRIGMQLLNVGASADDFSGGPVPVAPL
jgi:FtsP/CotA-like multicopper oxidase with cupredoxin domain